MFFYSTIILSLFLDLYTKYLAKVNLNDTINLFSNFVYLKYTENVWIAFSIAVTGIFLKIITIIIIIWIFIYYQKYEIYKKNKLLDFSFWLILWWALWNAYERIFNSSVIDFIWVRYFAIFNIADACITIWIILYIIVEIKRK